MNRDPLIIEFPLRGEWHAPTTPAKRIPSHGTNRMGLRYAFDFIRVNWDKKRQTFYSNNFLQYLLFGVPLNKCYCWGQKIYAPCDGEIIKVSDGFPERKRVYWLTDGMVAIKHAYFFDETKDAYNQLAGNYVVMKHITDVYLVFAHLQTNSIQVKKNQKIKKGELLGKVGHSGNSLAPHLHFQIMDSQNISEARGIPCLFEEYQCYKNGVWKTVYHQIPSEKDRIRFFKSRNRKTKN